MTKSGGEIWKRKGRTSTAVHDNQVLTGFVTKPAQITRPARFGGRVAANFIANGVEKDSASKTNESVVGAAAAT